MTPIEVGDCVFVFPLASDGDHDGGFEGDCGRVIQASEDHFVVENRCGAKIDAHAKRCVLTTDIESLIDSASDR